MKAGDVITGQSGRTYKIVGHGWYDCFSSDCELDQYADVTCCLRDGLEVPHHWHCGACHAPGVSRHTGRCRTCEGAA
jgi:hypothetical protein